MLILLGAFAIVPLALCRGSCAGSAPARSTSRRSCRSSRSRTRVWLTPAVQQRSHALRVVRLDSRARHPAVDADGHPRLGDGPHRHRRRRARDDLLPLVLPRQDGGARTVLGGAARLRRGDVRTRAHRRPRRAGDVLGDHERPVVPADRLLPPPRREPPRGAAGAAGHDARRSGDAHRRRAAGRGDRHVEPLRRSSPRRRPDRSSTRRSCCCWSERSASRRSSRSTSGCPAPWPRPPR